MKDTKSFWTQMPIPFQDEDESYDFANPVVISQDFLRATALAAEIGEKAEVLTEELANLEILKERAIRRRNALIRDIMVNHYDSLSKSARSTVHEAFVYKKAKDEGRLPELCEIDADIEKYTREIEAREPRLSQFKNRLRLIENKMEWAKEYLNYEKHVDRIYKHNTR